MRRECTALPWIEAKRSARPVDEGAPITLAFPSGAGGGGGGAVLLCGGAGGGNAGRGAGLPGSGGGGGTADQWKVEVAAV